VAVNLSPVQVKNKRLIAVVRKTLEERGLPVARLELEITETVLLQDTDAVMTLLHGRHELGVRISMDDFGTGYSSLSYLLRFPFDKIKIDRSFISELREVPEDTEGSTAASDTLLASARNAAIIVRTMVELCRLSALRRLRREWRWPSSLLRSAGKGAPRCRAISSAGRSLTPRIILTPHDPNGDR
jgi:EAL domain-containing protein (putative c-di-GMP-specific phosphodiesterase class I)